MIRTNGVDPDPRVEKEVNALIKNRKHTVTILAWSRDDNVDSISSLELENGQARIIRYGIPSVWGGGMKKNLLPLCRFSLKVHRWLGRNKRDYDCIHCCDLPTAVMAFPYIKYKKFVYDIYDYFSDTANAPKIVLNYARKKETYMIEHADATIICSEQRKKQIGEADPKKLFVIHNSPDSSLLEKAIQTKKQIIKSRSNKPKLVYVGNLVSDRFISEIIEIIAKRDDIELHIGGVGVLVEEVHRASIEYENIYYYGKLPYSDVIALENDCDIFLALYDPSVVNNQYAAPNKFYEALLVGKPLVMINHTGVDSLVSEYKIGAIAKSSSKESIEEAIDEILAEKTKWKNLQHRMRNIYNDKYSWKVMEERLCRLYEEI